MERATDAKARAGCDQMAHPGIAAVAGVGGVVHGQGIVVAAPLPIMNERNTVSNAVTGQGR